MVYYLKKHWKINLFVVLLQILYAGLLVTQNVILMNVFQGIIELNRNLFLFWTACNFGLWLVISALEGVRDWGIQLAIRSMNNHVREDIVATLLKKSHQEYHKQQSGEYLSWFTNDVNQIEKLAWEPFYNTILNISQIVFSIAVLAYMHWSLLAASVFAALLIIGAPKLANKKIETLSKACTKEQAMATGALKNLLAGLDVLRSFGRTDRFIRENREASDQLERPKYRLNYIQTWIGIGISNVSLVCQTLVAVLIGVLSIQGLIIQSALMGCGNICGTVYNGLAALGRYRLSIQASKPYFEKITVHAGDSGSESQCGVSSVKNAITVENLSFQYGEKPILKNASFRFEKGGKYALTGPSGCGKSTLLKLLLGWLPDYTGTIRFDGKDAREFTAGQLQQQMSYIEQDVFLFDTTIRENITLGMDVTDEALQQAIRGSALDADLANMPLGLDTPVGEDGSSLSGGQKQRVAIARALIHNRSVLLVDEGTSALDQKNADIVEKSLLENPDLTLILVSHHLSPERKAQFDQVFELEPAACPANL